MSTFVLVPGGWCGAWAYEAVEAQLTSAGHSVRAVTLTGLEAAPPEHLVRQANLDTHVDDVLRVLDSLEQAEVTLVGHSYGGLVSAAVADRASDRVTRLVQLDAYVPADGESCWSLTSDRFRAAMVRGAARTGFAVDPPKGSPERARPHPLASFMQGARITGAMTRIPRREFVFCSAWEGTPFAATRDRLLADPGWRVIDVPFGHDLPQLAPAVVTALLLDQSLPVGRAEG